MGVFDDRLKEKLLRDAKTLVKAMEIVQSYEASKSQMESIASASASYMKDIHVVGKKNGRHAVQHAPEIASAEDRKTRDIYMVAKDNGRHAVQHAPGIQTHDVRGTRTWRGGARQRATLIGSQQQRNSHPIAMVR